jgi:hypothetical protein
MQGSNIFDGILQKLIKEDHFGEGQSLAVLRAPQGCLRSDKIVRTTLYKNASELTSSRLSDYSLVKEQIHKPLQ